MKTERLHIRLTAEMEKWLSAAAVETGQTKTDIVVKALEVWRRHAARIGVITGKN